MVWSMIDIQYSNAALHAKHYKWHYFYYGDVIYGVPNADYLVRADSENISGLFYKES